MSHEVAILFAIREGFLDQVAVERVAAVLGKLRRRLDDTESDLLDTIEREDEISTASTSRLRHALESVQQAFPGKAAT